MNFVLTLLILSILTPLRDYFLTGSKQGFISYVLRQKTTGILLKFRDQFRRNFQLRLLTLPAMLSIKVLITENQFMNLKWPGLERYE